MMKAKLEVNVKEAIKRFRAFSDELKELCKKYELSPELAKDNETNDNFIVINVKDFIKEEDINMEVDHE